MRVLNDSLVSGAIDLSDDWASSPQWLGHIGQYSIQLVFSGSVVGTWSLQISDDQGIINSQSQSNQVTGVDNWSTISGSQQAVTEGGTHAWDIESAGHNWVRVVFEAGAGSGSLDSGRCYTKGF